MLDWKLRLPSVLAALAVATPLLSARAQTEPAAPRHRQPPGATTQPDDRDARASLQKVLDGANLLLGTGPKSASQRFQVCVTMLVPIPGGNATASDYVIARDGENVAILIRSPHGPPFGYATKGLLVSFDQRERGRLALCERGAPRFELAGDGEHLDLEFSFARTRKDPEIVLDLNSLLRDAAKAATRVERDRTNTNAIHLAGPRSDMWVVLSPEEGPDTFPLFSFVLKSKKGPLIAVSGIKLGGERSSILGKGGATFASLGLPMVDVTQGDKVSLLFVPQRFGEHPAEKTAADRLRRLFPGVPAASEDPEMEKDRVGSPGTELEFAL